MDIARDFYTEFDFNTSRSGGAGGQHVNKVSSKVELRFNVDASQILTSEEKELIKTKLKSYITLTGILQVVSQEERSQAANKEICIKKFYALLKKAFTRQKKRKPTKPTRSSKEERLNVKKKASIKKSFRSDKNFDQE